MYLKKAHDVYETLFRSWSRLELFSEQRMADPLPWQRNRESEIGSVTSSFLLPHLANDIFSLRLQSDILKVDETASQ